MIFGALVFGLAPTVFLQETTGVDFQRDIRPLLSDRCFSCHGPDSAGRDSELRLDSAAAAFKDLGGYVAIVPGDLEASELIYRITADDADERMPPQAFNKQLSKTQVELLKQWVKQGGKYQKHWSFITPQSAELPKVKQTDWPRNPIDHFVLTNKNVLDSYEWGIRI
mgnify:CR=1 FL=1